MQQSKWWRSFLTGIQTKTSFLSLCNFIFPRSEDGSTEDLVTCTVCELDVEEGDGYRIHLKDIHNISMEDIEQMD